MVKDRHNFDLVILFVEWVYFVNNSLLMRLFFAYCKLDFVVRIM
jgi:hypothetical protein